MALPAAGKLPNNTGLSHLGYSPAMLSKLTPAAAKVTKGDLVALRKWATHGGKGKVPGHLTIEDVNSLARAYGSPTSKVAMLKKASEGTTYCCCCSPCCCCTAAAEISPVRSL